MGEKIIDMCIETYCTTLFWDECKERVKAMFVTACVMDDIEQNTSMAKRWIKRIFECFDDWYDRNAFEKEVFNYLTKGMN